MRVLVVVLPFVVAWGTFAVMRGLRDSEAEGLLELPLGDVVPWVHPPSNGHPPGGGEARALSLGDLVATDEPFVASPVLPEANPDSPAAKETVEPIGARRRGDRVGIPRVGAAREPANRPGASSDGC